MLSRNGKRNGIAGRIRGGNWYIFSSPVSLRKMMHYYSGPLLSRLIVQRQHQCSPGFRRPHLTSQHSQGQNKGDFKDAAFRQKELPLSTPVTKILFSIWCWFDRWDLGWLARLTNLLAHLPIKDHSMLKAAGSFTRASLSFDRVFKIKMVFLLLYHKLPALWLLRRHKYLPLYCKRSGWK